MSTSCSCHVDQIHNVREKNDRLSKILTLILFKQLISSLLKNRNNGKIIPENISSFSLSIYFYIFNNFLIFSRYFIIESGLEYVYFVLREAIIILITVIFG